MNAPRFCSVCGCIVHPSNKIGICTRRPKCREANKKAHDRNGRPHRKSPTATARESAWEIPDDGIIDKIAIEIAVLGIRKVCLTRPEQKIVIERMLLWDYGHKDLCDHLGVGPRKLEEILDELGYESITDPAMSSAKYSNRRLITRKDRPRGEKMLTDLDNIRPRLKAG